MFSSVAQGIKPNIPHKYFDLKDFPESTTVCVWSDGEAILKSTGKHVFRLPVVNE